MSNTSDMNIDPYNSRDLLNTHVCIHRGEPHAYAQPLPLLCLERYLQNGPLTPSGPGSLLQAYPISST